MAEIVNIEDGPLERMSLRELREQELVQHGAIHALQDLIRRGVTRENADAQLRELVSSRKQIERVRNRKNAAQNREIAEMMKPNGDADGKNPG